MRAEREIRRADDIAHILNEQQIQFLQVQFLKGFSHQVGIEMAFLAGVYLEHISACRLYPFRIDGCGGVACQRRYAVFVSELFNQLSHEGGLPRAYRAHDVDCQDLVAIEELFVLFRQVLILAQQVFVQLDIENLPLVGSNYLQASPFIPELSYSYIISEDGE